MSWLDKLLPRKDDGEEDAIVAMFNQWRKEEPQEEEQAGGEDYYYCGECRGYIPISSFPHPHVKQ